MHGRPLEVMSLQEAIAIVVVSAKASSQPALEEICQLDHALIDIMAMSKVSISGRGWLDRQIRVVQNGLIDIGLRDDAQDAQRAPK
jgi:hypothetical protein